METIGSIMLVVGDLLTIFAVAFSLIALFGKLIGLTLKQLASVLAGGLGLVVLLAINIASKLSNPEIAAFENGAFFPISNFVVIALLLVAIVASILTFFIPSLFD